MIPKKLALLNRVGLREKLRQHSLLSVLALILFVKIFVVRFPLLQSHLAIISAVANKPKNSTLAILPILQLTEVILVNQKSATIICNLS